MSPRTARSLTAPLLFVVGALLLGPSDAPAQRFGGQYGVGAGFWMLYLDPGVDAERAFGRGVGNVVALGGRGFVQLGRVRLGGGGFAGGFTDEGLNPAGNPVEGRLSGGGFTAEYLVVQQNFELIVGGMAGGGALTIEEELSSSGGVDELRRRQDTIFLGYPWVRAGYNVAPFVNVGFQLGYLVGGNDVDGFAASIDIVVGLIP